MADGVVTGSTSSDNLRLITTRFSLRRPVVTPGVNELTLRGLSAASFVVFWPTVAKNCWMDGVLCIVVDLEDVPADGVREESGHIRLAGDEEQPGVRLSQSRFMALGRRRLAAECGVLQEVLAVACPNTRGSLLDLTTEPGVLECFLSMACIS